MDNNALSETFSNHQDLKTAERDDVLNRIRIADPYCGKDPFFDTLIPRRAAVMIPLIEKEDGYHILFEVRSAKLDLQPGDISLPGGHLEKEETSDKAVIREVSEELALHGEQIDIIRKLPLQTGPGGVIVTPFVGVLHDYQGTFDKNETDCVFTVPLAFFMNTEPKVYPAVDEVKMSEEFPYEKVNGGQGYHFMNTRHDFYFYDFEGTVIWGFTAKMIKVLVRMLKNGKK